MIYHLVTPATSLPVSLVDGKAHLRVSHSSHDDLITDLIWAASREFENRTNQCLSAQTWKLTLSQAEVTAIIRFNKYPVTSITSVGYYDSDNTAQVTTDYTLFTTGRPASLRFDCDSDEVPDTYDRDDSMTITFVAGYTTIPTDVHQAILARVFRIYENPNDPVTERMSYFDKIANSYRSFDF